MSQQFLLLPWGGDVATLYGNGDSVITTADSDLGKLGLKNTVNLIGCVF